MAITLEQSNKFKKEFTTYQEKINKVTNETIKAELKGYLQELLNAVRSIDMHHQELSMRKDLPSGVSDARTNIVSIRKKLDRKLEAWARATS